jgi:hypothetical protein
MLETGSRVLLRDHPQHHQSWVDLRKKVLAVLPGSKRATADVATDGLLTTRLYIDAQRPAVASTAAKANARGLASGRKRIAKWEMQKAEKEGDAAVIRATELKLNRAILGHLRERILTTESETHVADLAWEFMGAHGYTLETAAKVLNAGGLLMSSSRSRRQHLKHSRAYYALRSLLRRAHQAQS